jgi:D-3-phosphoglycerate dehydrogenase
MIKLESDRMASFHVLVTAQHLVPEAQQMLRDAGGDIEFMDEPIDEQSLIQKLSQERFDAVLLRGSKPFTAKVLAATQKLKIIAKNGAGIDSVDLEEATRRGVTVAVAAGANAQAVAEHAIALILTLVRQLNTLDAKVKQGGWEGSSWLGRDFRGSVVGILGFGSIGQSTAQLAQALGAEVVVFHPGRESIDHYTLEKDFDRFLSQIDILSLHCPLTDNTKRMIGARELGLLKPGSIVINTARGPILDEAALIDSLKKGHLGGAGLDTFEIEPIASNNSLLRMDNVVLTPHVAGVTRNAAKKVATLTAQNIIDTLAKKKLPVRHLVAGPSPETRV